MRTHPTVLLFRWRNRIDHLPALLLYGDDLPMLRTFGGINMDFTGFGALLGEIQRHIIRRTFRTIRSTTSSCSCMGSTCSRSAFRCHGRWKARARAGSGKLMPPRYGLLKYTLDAAHDAGVENVHIYPFVTSFDLIRDVEEYAAEQTADEAARIAQVAEMGYVRSLRRPMGRSARGPRSIRSWIGPAPCSRATSWRSRK